MGGLFKKVAKGEYKPIPRQYSGHLADLIDQMLVVKPKHRASIGKTLSYNNVLADLLTNEPLMKHGEAFGLL